MKLAAPVTLAVVLAAASIVSCAKCGAPNDEPAQAMKLPESPLPAPENLLADITMGTPNASWGKLQRGIGGAVGILPASAGGIICTAAGLDPFIASEIDGTAPIYGAVAGDPASPGYLLALKLTDFRKARGVLVDGETARYSSRDAGGVTELLVKGAGGGGGGGGAGSPPVAVGLSPNGYLLIARRGDDFGRLAPYVTRTLPKRPLPAEGAIVFDMPRAALGSLVKPKLDELWATAKTFLLGEDERLRREHGGRAPDFGDPKAIVAIADGWMTKRIAVVGDLEKMRIAVDFADDGVSIVSTMTPVAGGGPAAKWTDAMKTGDLAALGALPATAAAALSMRDGEEERAEQSRELEKAMTSSFGARLAEPDAKKLHGVVEDLTKARGDLLTSALAWDDPQGFSLRAPVRDADAASRAVRGALDLAKVSPFKELLRVRDVTTTTEDVAGAKPSVVTIARDAPPGKPASPPTSRPASMTADAGAAGSGAAGAGAGANASKRAPKDQLAMAWLVDGGMLSIGAGDAPLATLGAALRPDRKLADEPSIARTFKVLGSEASSVLVVQPLRFDPVRANLPAAPLVVALGRKDKDATLRIDIAHGLLRELARRQMGL